MIDRLIKKKLSKIKLVLMDVDGVLTNGEISYTDSCKEIKRFNVKDGLGIKLLLKTGIKVGIITGRTSNALTHRCIELGITYFKDSINNKYDVLNDLLEKNNISKDETVFIGDDLNDISIMMHVGLSVAVADANEVILDLADFTTFAKGGEGAVREIADLILKYNGTWDEIIKTFY